MSPRRSLQRLQPRAPRPISRRRLPRRIPVQPQAHHAQAPHRLGRRRVQDKIRHRRRDPALRHLGPHHHHLIRPAQALITNRAAKRPTPPTTKRLKRPVASRDQRTRLGRQAPAPHPTQAANTPAIADNLPRLRRRNHHRAWRRHGRWRGRVAAEQRVDV